MKFEMIEGKQEYYYNKRGWYRDGLGIYLINTYLNRLKCLIVCLFFVSLQDPKFVWPTVVGAVAFLVGCRFFASR